MSNSHTKFGKISSKGLGGDNITDGRTDRQTDAITISPLLFKKRVEITSAEPKGAQRAPDR